jgi:prolyl oligopeptidase
LSLRAVLILAAAGLLPACTAVAADRPPEAARRPVVDEYHGEKVTDPYRWLEDWNDPQVKAWSEAENAYARSVLDHLPGVAEIRSRVSSIVKVKLTRRGSLDEAGGTLFALDFKPPKQQSILVVLPSEDDPAGERVVLDPNALDAKGGTAIDWYRPSPDGKRVAVSLSAGGSEAGDVHVYDVATGKQVGDPVPRVNGGTAGGGLAWDADGQGFFYTRYPRAGERPPADLDFFVQVYHHVLGSPTSEDRYEIGRDFPRIAEIALERSRDGQRVLATVANGDGGEFAHYLRGPDGAWRTLTRFSDGVKQVVFGPHDTLLLLSRADAPRGKVLRLPLAAVSETSPLDRAQLLVPQGEAVIEGEPLGGHGLVATENRIFVIEGRGGTQGVRILDLDGKEVASLPVPPVASVYAVVPRRARGADTVLFQTATYVEPASWYRFDAATGASTKLALSDPWPVDLGDVEVIRATARSKDGTQVPMTILRRKGTASDGKGPALLTGYGGYGISLNPAFDPLLRVWIDAGGTLAIANLRGGGEFGEEWHNAGRLTKKQNVFDDFVACAEELERAGYAARDRLAIQGGSNGGLLMGAALTQRPDLFRVVVSHVGIYDMLRVELSPNGAFNVTEFGTVNDPDQFEALLAYSPYHRVRDGAAYPPVLFLTGANDPRVDPLQSRKMTARLQAAGATVLLRTSATSGHGIGTALDERIEQETDVLAFLFKGLGMRLPPQPPPPLTLR